MKLFQKAIVTAALTLAALSAQATTIFSTANIVSGKLDATTAKTLTVTHTLEDYVAADWTLTSATLIIDLYDNVLKGNETWKFSIGSDNGVSDIVLNDVNGHPYKNIANGVRSTAIPFTYLANSTVLNDLKDGVLQFTITALSGNFSFVGSELTVMADEVITLEPEELPEPMNLALFAIGLLGFGAARRRMK